MKVEYFNQDKILTTQLMTSAVEFVKQELILLNKPSDTIEK